MSATPFLEEILFLVAQFLRKTKHEELADQLQQHIVLPAWVQNNNPLIKKGLAKIVKEYVKTQPKLQEYYENRGPQEEVQEEEEIEAPKRKRSSDRIRNIKSPELPKQNQKHDLRTKNSPKLHTKVASPKNNGSSWMSKFQKPKRLEDIHHDKIIEEKVQKEQSKAKPSKKQKKVKIESSDYESEDDSFELEPKKKLKKQVKVEKVATKQTQKKKVVQQSEPKEEVKVQPKVAPQVNHQQPRSQQQNNYDGPRKFFSRINVNQLEPIKNQLLDNTFEAKGKYGQAADEWGKFGYEKLKDTRGDSFKKTKGKLKNRAFQGNLMDVNLINSIPIL